MPTTVGPNTFGEENLVFGYDLGDSVNSYKGEPATNSQAYDQSAMTSAGFDGWGCYDGNNSTPAYHSWDVAQSKLLVNIPGPFRKNVNAMLYHNFTGGFHGPTHWSGIPGSALTANTSITVQGWVKAADAASVGKTVTPYIYYYLSGGGAASSSTNFTLTSEWQLVSHTHNITTAGTSGILYFFTGGGTNIKMYLTMTGAIPNKGHAVPWLAGGTTRSNTQGLIDLKGNSSIDLTNVSFDSNAQMTFDGTNDYIQLADGTKWFTNEWAYEMVVKFNGNTGTYQGLLWGEGAVQSGYSGYQKLFSFYNYQYFHYRVGNSVTGWGNTNFTPSNFTPGNYNHIVWQFKNGTTNIAINGEIVHTDTSRGSYNAGTNSPLFIGARNDVWGVFNGNMPYLKRYSRVLTASEISANYKAIKGRFNI